MSNESRVPRGVPTGGQFAASTRGEAGVGLDPNVHNHNLSLGPDASAEEVLALAEERRDRDAAEFDGLFPSEPLTPWDATVLAENRGVLQDGYDDYDINRLFGQFESANLQVIWDYKDSEGFGGSSEIVGMALVPTSDPLEAHANGRRLAGSVRDLHPDVWEYLTDPECDIDPERIPSLLSDVVSEAGDPDRDLFDLPGDGQHNLTVHVKDEPCSHCGNPVDESGEDDYCGPCAYLADEHSVRHECSCGMSETTTYSCPQHGPDGFAGRCPRCPS